MTTKELHRRLNRFAEIFGDDAAMYLLLEQEYRYATNALGTSSPAAALIYAFPWSDTPEGHFYWYFRSLQYKHLDWKEAMK